MRIFKDWHHQYKCQNCHTIGEISGVLFPGIEIIIDGMPFKRDFFLCERCLKEALSYLGSSIKEIDE